MSVEAVVRFTDQLSIETFFAAAGFVSGNEQDGVSLWVKGEGDAPDSIGCIKRSSFMLAWRESFSVSARGLPKCGPNC